MIERGELVWTLGNRGVSDWVIVERAHTRAPLDERVTILWRGEGPDDLPRRGRDNGPTTFGGSRDYLAAVGWRLGPGGLFDVGRIRAARARLGEANWNVEKLKDGIT